jgi:general secretion pathway protein A
MYEQFFGFRESPFRVTPDPRFLYHNPCYDEAIAALSYGIEQRKGFVTLVGEVGTGKTTLLRHLLDTIAPNVRTVLLLYPTVSFIEILEQILSELGIPVEGARKAAMLQRLHEFLLDHTASGGNVALLFDEAQALDAATLEELRLLSNLETGSEKIVQIVLAGQPELEERLRRPEHRQLRQRIALHIRLRPLATDEVAAYVRTRLQHVGAPDLEIFEPAALARIGQLTEGIPRIVNVLCDACCTTALATESARITLPIVDEAWRDFEGLLPEPAGAAEAPASPPPPAATSPVAPPPAATPPPAPTPPPTAAVDRPTPTPRPPAHGTPPPRVAPPPRVGPRPPTAAPRPPGPSVPGSRAGSRGPTPPSTSLLVGGALLAAAIGAFLAFRIGVPAPVQRIPPMPPVSDTPTIPTPPPVSPTPTALAPAPPPTTPPAPATPTAERPSAMEALDVVDAFRAAYEAQDLSAIASLFTPNATKGEIVGRDKIVADYQRFFEGTSDIFYAQPSASVEPRADHVLVRAPFDITYRDSTGRPVEVRGVATWKIVRLGASARIAALDFQLEPVAAP